MNSNFIVVGKTSAGNEKEDFDNDADDDDVDNAEESEGEEFEQETGWRSYASMRTYILVCKILSEGKCLYQIMHRLSILPLYA